MKKLVLGKSRQELKAQLDDAVELLNKAEDYFSRAHPHGEMHTLISDFLNELEAERYKGALKKKLETKKRK